MSRPTCTALQRLRKLVGYLKATPNYCVLVEIPTGGQGKWHATDQFWLLESFSDSDWSSNQSHRCSTSCGVHMLNGSFLFASSRAQRVVSLSSCESELHAMVSTLSDGIFLRRCIQFVCKCEAERMMYTDSSSGRQLVMRQGTGKVKHVSERFCGYRMLYVTTFSSSVKFQPCGISVILEPKAREFNVFTCFYMR